MRALCGTEVGSRFGVVFVRLPIGVGPSSLDKEHGHWFAPNNVSCKLAFRWSCISVTWRTATTTSRLHSSSRLRSSTTASSARPQWKGGGARSRYSGRPVGSKRWSILASLHAHSPLLIRNEGHDHRSVSLSASGNFGSKADIARRHSPVLKDVCRLCEYGLGPPHAVWNPRS